MKLDFLRPGFEFTVHSSAESLRLRVEQINYDPDIKNVELQIICRMPNGYHAEVEVMQDESIRFKPQRSDAYEQAEHIEMHDPASWEFDV